MENKEKKKTFILHVKNIDEEIGRKIRIKGITEGKRTPEVISEILKDYFERQENKK